MCIRMCSTSVQVDLSKRRSDSILNTSLQHAGFRPPASVSWSSHSLRSGAASAARAVGFPEHIIAHRGGWAQDSAALGRRYIDPSTQPSPAAGMFFGRLAGAAPATATRVALSADSLLGGCPAPTWVAIH